MAYQLNSCRRPFVILIALLLCVSQAFGLRLGGLNLVYKPAAPLAARMTFTPGALTGVGGVAFTGVAKPKNGEKIKSLSYDPTKPDGERLHVVVLLPDQTSVTTHPKIYDWQLVPLVRLVASGQNSCISLFGELENQTDQAVILERGGEIINYQKDLADTLLGLRLFQSDLLILMEDACDIPRDDDGKHILGAGESEPRVKENQDRLAVVHDLIDKHPVRFQSFVICDRDQEVTFSVTDRALMLTGRPIWWCWRAPEDKGWNDEEARLRGWMKDEMQKILTDRTLNQGQKSNKATELTKDFRRRENDLIDKMKIEHLADLSKAITDAVEKQAGINPAIWDALVLTMRYSALLRHVQATDPGMFKDLAESVKSVKPTPDIKTPTVMEPDAKARRRPLEYRAGNKPNPRTPG